MIRSRFEAAGVISIDARTFASTGLSLLPCTSTGLPAGRFQDRQGAEPPLGRGDRVRPGILVCHVQADEQGAVAEFGGEGAISNHVFWPRMLLLRWSPDEASMEHVVDEAVLAMEARYAT